MSTPARAVLRTEFRLFLREPGSLFWIMVFPGLLLGILGLIPDFREPSPDLDGQKLIALYVPTAILLAAIFASVSAMPVVMATYREQRVLRRLATTPAHARDVLAAQYALHGAAAAVGGALAMTIAWAVYDVSLPGRPLAYVLVFFLVLAASLGIGGVVAGAAPNGRIAATIGTILIFPLMFTAGVWLPVQAMPGLLGTIVEFTPFGAASVGLDDAALGHWPNLRQVLTLVVWTVGLGAIATRFFRWE